MTIKLILGFISTFVLMIIIMPFFIKYLKSLGMSQEVSEYALEEYKKKAKTPIMGGLLFVIIPVIIFIFIERTHLDSRILLVLFAYLGFAFVGFLDDFMIILRHNNEGLSPIAKLVLEAIITIGLYILFGDDINMVISIPISHIKINLLPFIFIPLMLLMFLGEANAVNFTDGMDGLCAGVSSIAVIGFMIITYHKKEYVLLTLLVCVLGGLIGYLFFNWHPAKIFMGDSGSLALGSLFASIALLLNDEIILLIIGGVFLIEMGCVVIQQVSVRLFHKRVFRYTPIHYAFVLKGDKEVPIVLCFFILEIFFTVIGVLFGLL